MKQEPTNAEIYEKLGRIESRVEDRLAQIYEQVKATNGRVTKLEKWKDRLDSLGNRICLRNQHAPLTFTANVNLAGSGDVLSLTLPLLQDMRLEVEGLLSTNCINTPSCAMYSTLYVDGTNVDQKRIDTSGVGTVWASFPHAWQQTVSSGSRIIKLNLTLGGGGYFQYTAATLKITARPA